MGGTGVIDRFLAVFTQYIDSGFGLLGGEVAFIATTLIVIDVTLAALFWSWGADDDIIARLVKKTLFVGVFAYLIGNWNSLSRIVFESFAGLGLKASGTGMAEADFLRPGRIAQVGLDAGRPILDSISGLMGYVSFFENFIQITVLLFAWVMVLLAFFILAIQLFITLIEFKLTTLAGFVLIPFGLFGKTAFAAERVLGNVVSSGIKVLVLAVIVGIGSTLFSLSSPRASAAHSRRSTTPWRSCSRRWRCSASASSGLASQTGWCRADRSSAPALPSRPASPLAASSRLAPVSRRAARASSVAPLPEPPAAVRRSPVARPPPIARAAPPGSRPLASPRPPRRSPVRFGVPPRTSNRASKPAAGP